MSEEHPAPDGAPSPDQPALTPTGSSVTESGYSFTVVDDTAPKQQASREPKVKRESTSVPVGRRLLVAIVVVPALLAAAAAWFVASSFDDGGGGDDRTNANVASVINAFSSGQGGSLRRIEGALPPGFPEDVPAYPGAEVVSSLISVSGEDVVYLVIYDTGDGLDDVTAHFDEALADDPWQIDGGQDARDTALRQFSKIDDADVEGLFLLAESNDANLTTIFLSVEVTSGADETELEEFEPEVTKPLPDGFPEGIPQYPDAVVIQTGFQKQPQGTRYSVSLITRDSNASVLTFFRDAFETDGWSVADSDASQAGLLDAEAITFESDTGDITGNIVAGEFAEDKNYTRVEVNVFEP